MADVVLAAEVGVVVEGGAPAVAEGGVDSGSGEDAVPTGVGWGVVEGGAGASAEGDVEAFGAVEVFVLPEEAAFGDEGDGGGELPGVGEAAADVGAEAVGVFGFDS